jgi:hypothetical protein
MAEFTKSGSCNVNEESMWDLGERIVLVVAEPGMGKSGTTKHVGWHTKERDLTSWFVRINWNDHTGKLEGINRQEKFGIDSLVKFLCSAAFPDPKYTDINSSLLKQALQNSGNVTLLMDGFDEICPIHVVLSELINTKEARVWVTLRPVVKERLGKILSVSSFNTKKISHKSQEGMISKLWMLKTCDETVNLNRYLLCVYKTVHYENFTGCQLYITMIATVSENGKGIAFERDECN